MTSLIVHTREKVVYVTTYWSTILQLDLKCSVSWFHIDSSWYPRWSSSEISGIYMISIVELAVSTMLVMMCFLFFLLRYYSVLNVWEQQIQPWAQWPAKHELCWWSPGGRLWGNSVSEKKPWESGWERFRHFEHCLLKCLHSTFSQPIAGWVIWGTCLVCYSILQQELFKFWTCKTRSIISHHSFWQFKHSKSLTQLLHSSFRGR